MQLHRSKLTALLVSCVIVLSGCASSPPQPGAVVVAPEVTKPAPPSLVQKTQPRPTGYYRQKILDALTKP